jgi:AraC-like DNA-binding protein
MQHPRLGHERQQLTPDGARSQRPLTGITEVLSDITARSQTYRFEERLSDSPYVDAVWRTPLTAEPSACRLNVAPIFPAAGQWGLIAAKHEGRTRLTIWGPGTKAAIAPCPRETEITGIMFKPGTFMPHLRMAILRERRDVTLPEAASHSFWMNGSAVACPDYENADAFVDWLVSRGLLEHDGLVDTVLQGQQPGVSLRSAQRRFLQATGMSYTKYRQMERAALAKELLMCGTSILDCVERVGYYDQAHLTKALKHFMGLTPSQLVRLRSAL